MIISPTLWRFPRLHQWSERFSLLLITWTWLNHGQMLLALLVGINHILLTSSSLCVWEIKTIVHKTQFFYLFVSRRTQTIDIYVYVVCLNNAKELQVRSLWLSLSRRRRRRRAHLLARQHVTMDEQTWNPCCVIHSKVYANLCTWAYV